MTMIALPPEPLQLSLGPAIRMDDAELFELCAANPDLRIERNREGDLIVMTPAGGRSSYREFEILGALRLWIRSTLGRYIGFSSSAGFVLPNGAKRSPDAACVLASRLTARGDLNERFLPVCPDLVVELRSATDALAPLMAKMEEYRDNGAFVGWLIDPYEKRVRVYRPGRASEVLEAPDRLSGDPEFPGLVLELGSIWAPPF